MDFDGRLLSGVGTLMAVAETGSFARAAEVLGLTPSGVSRAIGRLEARLALRLFDRNPRATTLTAAGRRLVADLAPLVAGMEEATRSAAGEAQAVQGRLRINCDPWFASLLLVPRLQAFLDSYPKLELDVVVRDRLGDLISDGFDAAVRFGEPEPSALITRKLLDTRIMTCAAPSYIARYGRPAHPEDLATPSHECLLFRDPATGRPFDWEFHRDGQILPVNVHGRLILDDATTSVSACLAGLGIAQPMVLGMAPLLESGRLIELFPDWNGEHFPLHVYHPSRHLPPAKVRAFLDFVSTTVGGPWDEPLVARVRM
ncbi:LysR family transcriptional regulator [Acidisoma cellulosilytica]|uniref:LysR family transcriptional regulator n=1 Tax=Acidisoma cellulosilyticum TaxID=2802395 RepID=A0A964E285_9PROT|nr:LysR family transcriptional regulator [Acidisoma cellulosilyticum]MCB8879345.1 LysR family transcriptional regulator [Acidisoma cellulosilyticum]